MSSLKLNRKEKPKSVLKVKISEQTTTDTKHAKDTIPAHSSCNHWYSLKICYKQSVGFYWIYLNFQPTPGGTSSRRQRNGLNIAILTSHLNCLSLVAWIRRCIFNCSLFFRGYQVFHKQQGFLLYACVHYLSGLSKSVWIYIYSLLQNKPFTLLETWWLHFM